MSLSPPAFTAIILAADRAADDPVATAAGVPCKSLTLVGGKPMVFRVVDALAAARQVSASILCGPPKVIVDREDQLKALIESGKVKWLENQASPSASAYHVLKNLPDETPVLLTTADHALLSAGIVDYFCMEAAAAGCDIVVGVARLETVTAAYPQTRRTAVRLRDGAYCGCNLFAFLTPRARKAAEFWRRIEARRKNPLHMIRILGLTALLLYLTRLLTLDEALKRISHRLGLKAAAVILPFPEAAVDVDSVGDWTLVEKVLSSGNGSLSR